MDRVKRITKVLGISFDHITARELRELIRRDLREPGQFTIAFSNPEFLVAAAGNAALTKYLNETRYNLADGIGVVWASRFYGPPLPERVTGTDFVDTLCGMSEEEGIRIFFLGGKPGVAETAAVRLRKAYPNCSIVGTHHGYFSTEENAKVLCKINEAKPDVLMVCMGNPRQERWIEENRHRVRARLIFGNGGALDFAAGMVTRAPVITQNLGLEWLWRLGEDPSWNRIGRQLKLWKFVGLTLIDIANVKRGKRKPDIRHRG